MRGRFIDWKLWAAILSLMIWGALAWVGVASIIAGRW